MPPGTSQSPGLTHPVQWPGLQTTGNSPRTVSIQHKLWDHTSSAKVQNNLEGCTFYEIGVSIAISTGSHMNAKYRDVPFAQFSLMMALHVTTG